MEGGEKRRGLRMESRAGSEVKKGDCKEWENKRSACCIWESGSGRGSGRASPCCGRGCGMHGCMVPYQTLFTTDFSSFNPTTGLGYQACLKVEPSLGLKVLYDSQSV